MAGRWAWYTFAWINITSIFEDWWNAAFKMESSDRSDKPLPRLVEISRSIIIIYVILSLACVVSYLLVGLNPLDALIML